MSSSGGHTLVGTEPRQQSATDYAGGGNTSAVQRNPAQFSTRVDTESGNASVSSESVTGHTEPLSPSHSLMASPYFATSSPPMPGDLVLASSDPAGQGASSAKVSRREVAKYQCPDCSFVTSKLDVFREHCATHRNSEKEHECTVCFQKFKYKQSVKKHMMKHEGITPYHCSICDYKTNSHSSLEVHQRAHSGEKPFVCSHCGMRFAQNSQLRVHMQYHSNANNPYKCELCDYQSPNYYKLTRHMKVHRERPYSCELCNKKFMLPYQLRNHAATHTKTPESHFFCQICKIPFTDRAVYKKHIKEVHEKPSESPTSAASAAPNIPNDYTQMLLSNALRVPLPPTQLTLPQDEAALKKFITAISHGNNVVSTILHLPSASQSNAQTQSTSPAQMPSATPLTCSTDFSPGGISSAVGKLSVASSGSEHEVESKQETGNDFRELPEGVLVIKPEAAPSGAASEKPDSKWDFNECAMDEESVEHTSSPQTSPLIRLQPENVQKSMSSIFDKLLSRAVSAEHQQSKPDDDVLDLSMPVNDENIGRRLSNVAELESEQVLDLSTCGRDSETQDDESPPSPAKKCKVLPDEQAIIRTDNPTRPYKCGYCCKEFIQSSHIRVHLQYHVNAANPFRCTDCSYTSASKYKLNLHLKVHRERRFICDHCPSKFTLNCRLNQHVKVAHAEDLPFKCTLCDVTFSSTNLLAWHVSNKHENPTSLSHKLLVSSSL